MATCFGKAFMKTLFWRIRLKLQSLTMREEGQDLVEYALVISLVAIRKLNRFGAPYHWRIQHRRHKSLV
jgi:hypothetical protein